MPQVASSRRRSPSPPRLASSAALLHGPGRAGHRAAPGPAPATAPAQPSDGFRPLDDVIGAAMVRYGVPGVAVGVLHGGRLHQWPRRDKSEAPVPMDASTLFQTGSITKTYTATLMMRLVERCQVDLDAPVRRYLPDLALADAAVATRVTVRQLLNYTAGWFGDYFNRSHRRSSTSAASGRRRGGRIRHRHGQLPQLAPLGVMFGYNNAALALAERVITQWSPARPTRRRSPRCCSSRWAWRASIFPEEAISYPVAAGQRRADGNAVVNPWALPRAVNRRRPGLADHRAADVRPLAVAADGARLLSPVARRDAQPRPGLAFSSTGNGDLWCRRGLAAGADRRRAARHAPRHIRSEGGARARPRARLRRGRLHKRQPAGRPPPLRRLDLGVAGYLGLSTLPATVDLPAARLAFFRDDAALMTTDDDTSKVFQLWISC